MTDKKSMVVNEVSAEYSHSSMDLCPHGYKQTEIGVIPDDWDVKSVVDAYEICNTLRLPINDKVRKKMHGPYPYYGPTKIQDHINEYRVEGEYALIGEDGDHFLKYDTVPQTQLATGKFNVNNHAHLVKGVKGTTKWFFYFFKNRDISSYLTRQGAGRFKLNKASLETLPCVLPPILEQEKIAATLSDVDVLIVSLEKLIAKKRDIKTATMQQLLTGKKRLPGFGQGKGYKQTELGEIPEDWDVKQLNSVCSMKSGESITSESIKDDERFPCYGGNGLRGYTTRFTHDGSYALVGRQGALCGNVLGVDGKFFASEHAIVVTANNKTDINWLTLILGRMNLNQYSESSAQPGLSVSKLLPLEVVMPTEKSEQESISRVVLFIDAELLALQDRLEKIKAIKQGMMQELLTGRTRLLKPTEHKVS
jgi:type I restriction enzyme S subunit